MNRGEEKRKRIVWRGGKGSWEKRSKDFLKSPFSLPFFPPPPLHLYLSSPFLFHPLFPLHALCWITHAYLTLLHLQKQWTYSLAFRVLMKAPGVVAPSLFPYTSSQLSSCNPTSPAAYYTICSTSIPPKPCQAASLFLSLSFLCAKIQLQKDWLIRFKTEKSVGEVAEPHRVFSLFILHHFHPRLLYSYFTLLFNHSFSCSLSHCSTLTGGGGMGPASSQGSWRCVVHSFTCPHSPSVSFSLL